MEFTLDQLQSASGGVAMGPDGKGCTERDFYPYGDIFKDFKPVMPRRRGGKSILPDRF